MRIAILAASEEDENVLRTNLRGTNHIIIWAARTTDDAVQSGKVNEPDVILYELQGASGNGNAVATLRANLSAPILLIVRSIDGLAGTIIEALNQGALDVLAIEGVSRDAATHLSDRLEIIRKLRAHEPAPTPSGQTRSIVLIGASAGGPGALAEVLAPLPVDIDASIIVVQHLDAQFMNEMATWLGTQTQLPVRIAARDTALEPGVVYTAGRNEHLVLKDRYTLGYETEPRDNPYRPSIDQLFFSALRFWNKNMIGVVLTGMGSDGATGLLALRDAGALTISQDRASSAVFGIPKAAAKLNAAVEILPLDKIGPRLVSAVKQQGKRK